MKKLFLLAVFLTALLGFANAEVSCDFSILPTEQAYFKEGKIKGVLVQPGQTICIEAGTRDYMKFDGFIGTEANPIIITNHGGVASIDTQHVYGFVLAGSKHIKIQGTGDPAHKYGIKATAPKSQIVFTVDEGSTNIEVNNIEIYSTNSTDNYIGFAAKTDPSCDHDFVRGKREMKDLKLHDFYIHDINQGFYIGWTFFADEDRILDCSGEKKQGHVMQGVKIYNNIIENVGQDGMQISSAISTTDTCEIHDNIIKNASTKNQYGQRSSITIGGGSKCDVYNNKLLDGKGPGVLFMGYAGKVYNNLITNPGTPGQNIDGIFTDHRSGNEPAYQGGNIEIYNNTIINPERNGIRHYNATMGASKIHNNLLIKPGHLLTVHPNNRAAKENGSYIFLEKDKIDRTLINNGADLSTYLDVVLASDTDNLGIPELLESSLTDKIINSDTFVLDELSKIFL